MTTIVGVSGSLRSGSYNAALLRAVLQHPDFIAQRVDTTFLETHLDELRTAAAAFESAEAAITADPAAGGAP